MNPFAYPVEPHVRRHGPRGYANYESYRDWLRDEFSFRCVYCLTREQWAIAKGASAIDHFVPTSINPGLAGDYDNLLYACVACNLTRGNHLIPDPLEHLLASTVEVRTNGNLVTQTTAAQEIVEALHLNDPEYVSRRGLMIELLQVLAARRHDLYQVWLGYPDDLPNLARLRPPGGNSRPNGVAAAHFARHRRGELASTY